MLFLLFFNKILTTFLYNLVVRLAKIKKIIAIGDVLVSVNERIVLEEPFESVFALLDLLMYDFHPRVIVVSTHNMK